MQCVTGRQQTASEDGCALNSPQFTGACASSMLLLTYACHFASYQHCISVLLPAIFLLLNTSVQLHINYMLGKPSINFIKQLKALIGAALGRMCCCSRCVALKRWPSAAAGCRILADEMGLGKTLQVLATAWTLMRRGGASGSPVVRKLLVVAPSSVVKNWGQEVTKWLGTHRAPYLALLPGKDAAQQVRL